MKRIITLALLGITLTTGAALADRDRGHRNNDRRHDRVEHRDHNRDNGRWNRGGWRSDNRRGYDRRVVVQRSRPSYRNNTFYFTGGVTRTYRAPEIRYRYRNYARRPAILVENYDPMPGYVWMTGQWSWTGYEWSWTPGHYDVDVNYDANYNVNYDANYDVNYYDGY